MSRFFTRMGRTAIAMAAAVLFWWAAVVAFQVPAFLLPSPLAVWPRVIFLAQNASLGSHLLVTIIEILQGFVTGAMLGVAAGAVFVRVPRLERLAAPLILLTQTAPKIAVAPLLILWLGLGAAPKITLVAIVVFFPTMAGTMTGLRYIDSSFQDLAAVLRLTRRQRILKIEIPFALPPILAALRIASTQAVTAAVIGELMGANKGLGYLLAMGQENSDAAIVIAIVLILSLVGWFFYELIALLETALLSWHTSRMLDAAH